MLRKMIELCFLGTGGSVATAERDNTAFLIHREGRLVLVDCPGNIFQKIKRLDFDPGQVAAIFVTHVHPDHVYGLPALVHSLMLEERIIPLFASRETVELCMNLLDLFCLREEKIKTRIEFVPLEPEGLFQLRGLGSGSCFRVPHSPSSLAFHFRFEKEKMELVYSGDTRCSAGLFQKAAETDYLIHDCSAPSRFFKQYPSLSAMHTHALELGEHAQRSGVRCLIPCHFFGELDFSLQEVEEEIRRNYRGRLIVPRDSQRIAL